MLGRKLGKRGMLYGALAQSVPDIDFISALWNDTASNLLAHRGFTHSILFAILASIVLALAADRWQRPRRVRYSAWLLFFAVEIGIHLLIDGFNSYPIGLFEPFSHSRVSLDAMFVADPFFSLWPLIAFLVLLKLPPWHRKRDFWRRFGIVLPASYLLYCSLNKIRISDSTERILARQQVAYNRVFTTPTPLNNLLWYVVAEDAHGFHIGFRSVFDRNDRMDLTYFPRNDSLLVPVAGTEELQHLLRFSQGYYTVEKWGDTLVFNDLRFGQIIGWHDPQERFVFHFFLQQDREANLLVVQRGRFAKWRKETVVSMLRRIRGN